MKIKEGYKLKEVGGSFVVLYLGDGEDKLHGMIQMNAMAAFLWKQLEEGCTKEELLKTVLDQYDVEEAVAKNDINGILDIMKENDLLDL